MSREETRRGEKSAGEVALGNEVAVEAGECGGPVIIYKMGQKDMNTMISARGVIDSAGEVDGISTLSHLVVLLLQLVGHHGRGCSP